MQLKEPDEEELYEALEEFRGTGWIGRPEDSVEFELTGRNYPLKAPGVISLNNHLENPILAAGFRGVSVDEYNDLKESKIDAVQQVEKELIENEFYPIADRLDKIYEAIDIPYEIETFDVVFDDISDTITDALLIEKGFSENEEFQVESVVISGTASGDDLEDAYGALQKNTSLSINFQYNSSENPDIIDFGSISLGNEGYSVNTPGITGPADLEINLKIQQIYLDYVENDEVTSDLSAMK